MLRTLCKTLSALCLSLMVAAFVPCTVAAQGIDSAQMEARLAEIYTAIAEARSRDALNLAERLSQEQPNFQLGQMLYADLLLAQTRPVAVPGSAPEALTRAAPGVITDLRAEAKLRIKALQERPPAGSLPENFTALSAWSPQAIAIDISKSRLYLFTRNSQGVFQLENDYYISIARLGAVKESEGDLRTPLGPYFITSYLSPKQLTPFYGAGALPLNYPNPYDLRRGKTGSGIWLHGSPPEQYSRPPLASEGCVVLPDPDFVDLARQVTRRTTPVVIAKELKWVKAGDWEPSFDAAWLTWRDTRLAGKAPAMAPFYYANFSGWRKQKWPAFYRQIKAEMRSTLRMPREMKEVSRVYWRESAREEVVVTTFEHGMGEQRKTRRQYWRRLAGNPWRIFYESDI